MYPPGTLTDLVCADLLGWAPLVSSEAKALLCCGRGTDE